MMMLLLMYMHSLLFTGQLPIPVQIIENGTHLIVPNVTDDWQGFYQCVAHNQHGSGFSNQLQVQILRKHIYSIFNNYINLYWFII